LHDSPLERNGFELPVPRQIVMISSTRRWAILQGSDRGEPAALSTGDDARRRGHRSGRDVRRRGGTGIVVAGKDKNGRGYVLADISGRWRFAVAHETF